MYETALGPNERLIGAPAEDFADDVVTPALCIERSVFEANLAVMQRAATGAGKALRPHMKGHKSKMIAVKQRDAGAIGVSCATVKEVEAAADAGVRGILLTTPVASPLALEAIAELNTAGAGILLAIDSVEAARRIASATADDPIGIVIDLNVGQEPDRDCDTRGCCGGCGRDHCVPGSPHPGCPGLLWPPPARPRTGGPPKGSE